MNKLLAASVATLTLCSLAAGAFAAASQGEAAFNDNCASCHRDGGNIINPSKNLKKMTLKANGIRSAKDIMAKMRNPGPGMTKFDKQTLPDEEAKEIAEYILKQFK